MKNAIAILICCLMLGGCITTQVNTPHTMSVTGVKKNEVVLPEKKVTTEGWRFYLLWFPVGGRGAEEREDDCYNKMRSQYMATAVIFQRYEHKKMWLPFVLFSFVHRSTELTGRPVVPKEYAKEMGEQGVKIAE